MKRLTASKASQLVKSLDRIAEYVEKNYQDMGMPKKAAFDFCMQLDRHADDVERRLTAGEFNPAMGDVEYDGLEMEVEMDNELHREEDEAYMDTFHAPSRVHDRDMDESYMDHFNDSVQDSVADYVEEDRAMEDNPLAREASVFNQDNWYTRSKKARKDNWYTRGE